MVRIANNPPGNSPGPDNTGEPDANRDPITGAPGAHPVGVGLGTAGAGVAGAAIGAALGGPVGAVVGAVVGGVAGGYGGKAAAESINPTVEDAYWRENYIARPYVERHDKYENLQPAYQHGWESYSKYRDQYSSFEEAEPELSRDWESTRSDSGLAWDKAKPASRDAWDRVERQSTTAPCDNPSND